MPKKSTISLKERRKIAHEKFISENPEYMKEYNKKQYDNNREELNKRRKAEYHRNKEKYRERYKTNREELLKKAQEYRMKKQYQRTYRLKHDEKLKQYQAEYRENKRTKRQQQAYKHYTMHQESVDSTYAQIMDKFGISVRKIKQLLQNYTLTEILSADKIDNISDLILIQPDYDYLNS